MAIYIFKSYPTSPIILKLTPSSATIPDGPAVAMLEASPHVENVERDQVVTTM